MVGFLFFTLPGGVHCRLWVCITPTFTDAYYQYI